MELSGSTGGLPASGELGVSRTKLPLSQGLAWKQVYIQGGRGASRVTVPVKKPLKQMSGACPFRAPESQRKVCDGRNPTSGPRPLRSHCNGML